MTLVEQLRREVSELPFNDEFVFNRRNRDETTNENSN